MFLHLVSKFYLVTTLKAAFKLMNSKWPDKVNTDILYNYSKLLTPLAIKWWINNITGSEECRSGNFFSISKSDSFCLIRF